MIKTEQNQKELKDQQKFYEVVQKDDETHAFMTWKDLRPDAIYE